MSDEIQNLKNENDGMISDDDKLWAALSLAIGLIGLIMLFIPDKANRPFVRYAAVHGVAIGVIQFVLSIIPGLNCVTGIVALGLFGYTIYLAFSETYQGKYVELPYLSDFLKGQGWTQISG